MPAFIERIGFRYGRLVVISLVSMNPVKWSCLCDCGNTTIVRAEALGNCRGKIGSCGCRKRLAWREASVKHNQSKRGQRTPEYSAWHGMKTRCLNEKREDHKNYGGRGITICDEWKDSFQAFYECVGNRPGSSFSIERINNNVGYEPGNVRWATKTEQNRNKRSNRVFEYQGAEVLIPDISRATKIPKGRLYYRLVTLGWSVDMAVGAEQHISGGRV